MGGDYRLREGVALALQPLRTLGELGLHHLDRGVAACHVRRALRLLTLLGLELRLQRGHLVRVRLRV